MLLQISHYEEGQIIGRPELEETAPGTPKPRRQTRGQGRSRGLIFEQEHDN